MSDLALAIYALAGSIVVLVVAVSVVGVKIMTTLNRPAPDVISEVKTIVAERDRLRAANADLTTQLAAARDELAAADANVDALNQIDAAINGGMVAAPAPSDPPVIVSADIAAAAPPAA